MLARACRYKMHCTVCIMPASTAAALDATAAVLVKFVELVVVLAVRRAAPGEKRTALEAAWR